MGCCRDLAERFILLISCVMLVFSLIALGFSAYLAANFREEFDTLELDSPIVGAAGVGGLLLVFSIVGILGACWDNKCLLLIYLLGCLTMSFGIIVIGGVVLSQLGAFDNVEQLDNLNDDVEQLVVLFGLAAFDSCCIGANNGDAVECDALNDVEPCVNQADQAELDRFNAIQEGFFGDDPEDDCDRFDDFGFDTDAECGNNDPVNDREDFVDAFTEFLEGNLRQLGIANLIAGIIMLLLTIATCVLIWNSRDKYRK